MAGAKGMAAAVMVVGAVVMAAVAEAMVVAMVLAMEAARAVAVVRELVVIVAEVARARAYLVDAGARVAAAMGMAVGRMGAVPPAVAVEWAALKVKAVVRRVAVAKVVLKVVGRRVV